MIALLFGYLFLLFGIGLTYLQAKIFILGYKIPLDSQSLLLGLTTAGLIGAGLALSTFGRKFAGGLALLVCLGLMLVFAYHALIRPLGFGAWEYGVLIYYLLAFGIYGNKGLRTSP